MPQESVLGLILYTLYKDYSNATFRYSDMAEEMAHKGKRNEVSTYHIYYEKRELPHRQPVWPASTKC